MTIIDSYDVSAADEPELLETLASLARRPWHARGRRCASGIQVRCVYRVRRGSGQAP
jgi:hypothetical protein